MHLHITRSHVTTFKYHMHYPIWMACVSAAVISVTYLDIVTRKFPGGFSYKWALGTRLVIYVKTKQTKEISFVVVELRPPKDSGLQPQTPVRSGHETHKHRWLAPIDQLGSCIQCSLTSPCSLFTSPFKLETHNNEIRWNYSSAVVSLLAGQCTPTNRLTITHANIHMNGYRISSSFKNNSTASQQVREVSHLWNHQILLFCSR